MKKLIKRLFNRRDEGFEELNAAFNELLKDFATLCHKLGVSADELENMRHKDDNIEASFLKRKAEIMLDRTFEKAFTARDTALMERTVKIKEQLRKVEQVPLHYWKR